MNWCRVRESQCFLGGHTECDSPALRGISVSRLDFNRCHNRDLTRKTCTLRPLARMSITPTECESFQKVRGFACGCIWTILSTLEVFREHVLPCGLARYCRLIPMMDSDRSVCCGYPQCSSLYSCNTGYAWLNQYVAALFLTSSDETSGGEQRWPNRTPDK